MTGKGVNNIFYLLLRIQTLFLHWLGKFEDNSIEIHYAWECIAGSVAGDRQATSLSTQHIAAALAKEVTEGLAWEPTSLPASPQLWLPQMYECLWIQHIERFSSNN